MTLQELGEDRLVEKLTRGLHRSHIVIAGPGDDCAVLRATDSSNLLLLKTDCIVEAVHFDREARTGAVGWKAMARPLSDFAAMSGVPEFALVTLIAPGKTPQRWVTGLYRGLQKAADMFSVVIVGGETSSTAGPAIVSVSVSGWAEPNRWLSRTGGKSGDEIFVTGRLGGSRAGHHLRFVPRIAESRWLTAHFNVHAMIDLSDGLGADLPRLARASGLDYELEETAVPRNRACSIEQAISDGEDYELLFAIAPGESERLQQRWRRQFPKLPLTRIGRLISNPKTAKRRLRGGYVHFT
ncbi:MAG: thiamine-phosphate kinase [Chthoniobacterales bacterium]|nr:thiamine-phosphate kinase [Chthoniobacterales bacterium]